MKHLVLPCISISNVSLKTTVLLFCVLVRTFEHLREREVRLQVRSNMGRGNILGLLCQQQTAKNEV